MTYSSLTLPIIPLNQILYIESDNTLRVETCHWHVLYRFCLSDIQIVLSRVSAERERERDGGTNIEREENAPRGRAAAQQRKKIHFIMRTYCYWFQVWMGALIWLNSHYIVALNNPNVIRLKACLMLSTQGSVHVEKYSPLEEYVDILGNTHSLSHKSLIKRQILLSCLCIKYGIRAGRWLA